MFIKPKTKKVLSIITLILILILSLTFPVVFDVLFAQKIDPINISAIATIVLLLGLTLILFVSIRTTSSQTSMQNKTIKYFISMLLLLAFLSIFISSFGLYGLCGSVFLKYYHQLVLLD